MGVRERLGLYGAPIMAAFVILTLDRFAITLRFFEFLPHWPSLQRFSRNDLNFIGQAYYSIGAWILFIFLPLVFHFIFRVRGENLLGLKIRGTLHHYPPYLALLAIMLPVLWILCGTERFQNFYPMYRPVNFKMWLYFECVYLPSFVAVEFFFRGFLLFRFEKLFRAWPAVLVMIIPYSFIHIHKPYPEALGSIVAGLVLGKLALRSRSIWPGVLVHAGVAFFMDFFSLLRSGFWTHL